MTSLLEPTSATCSPKTSASLKMATMSNDQVKMSNGQSPIEPNAKKGSRISGRDESEARYSEFTRQSILSDPRCFLLKAFYNQHFYDLYFTTITVTQFSLRMTFSMSGCLRSETAWMTIVSIQSLGHLNIITNSLLPGCHSCLRSLSNWRPLQKAFHPTHLSHHRFPVIMLLVIMMMVKALILD